MEKRKRSRMFASGPTSNLIVALICSLIFTSVFIGSAEPRATGIGITGVVADSPAHNSSLYPGMIITSIYHNGNETPMDSTADFKNLMGSTSPGDNVTLTVYDEGQLFREDTTLSFRTDNTSVGFLGINTVHTRSWKQVYVPTFYPESLDATLYSMIIYVSLPIRALSPIDRPYTDFYEPSGALAAVPEPMFWILANSFYWVFWLNLMLGLTNALPAVPLDGGYVFRDGLDSLLEKVKKDMKPERRESIVKRVSYFLSFFILALILWQLIGPRVF